jgi:hypothetical protein
VLLSVIECINNSCFFSIRQQKDDYSITMEEVAAVARIDMIVLQLFQVVLQCVSLRKRQEGCFCFQQELLQFLSSYTVIEFHAVAIVLLLDCKSTAVVETPLFLLLMRVNSFFG